MGDWLRWSSRVVSGLDCEMDWRLRERRRLVAGWCGLVFVGRISGRRQADWADGGRGLETEGIGWRIREEVGCGRWVPWDGVSRLRLHGWVGHREPIAVVEAAGAVGDRRGCGRWVPGHEEDMGCRMGQPRWEELPTVLAARHNAEYMIEDV